MTAGSELKTRTEAAEKEEPKPAEKEEKDKEELKSDEKKALDSEELKELSCYHGFFAREDLQCLLKSEGDFLLRITDVENKEKGSDRQIVLCVMTYSQQQEERVVTADLHAKNLKVRNLVVTRQGGKYRIDSTAAFDTMKALIDHYKQPNVSNPLKVKLRYPVSRQNWEYAHTDIQFSGKVLGEGAFGEVREGQLRKKKNGRVVKVAVKMPKGQGELSKEKVKEMMREARLMRYFKHKNVVRLYGVAVLEQPIYILLELVDGGSLLSYLEKFTGLITTREKISIIIGAACGLEYLHKCGCIHRDIAARNYLYTVDKIIKISDFGLSKMETIYKIKTPVKLPIKWLAPETITQFQFSTKTDVYSYGVTLYEVFNDGKEPWDGFSNTETKKSVIEGKFLQLPKECPEKLRDFIQDKIYVLDPKKRVSMSDVLRFLENVMTESRMMGVQESRIQESKAEPRSDNVEKSMKQDDAPAPTPSGGTNKSTKQDDLGPSGAMSRESLEPEKESRVHSRVHGDGRKRELTKKKRRGLHRAK